ncbi:MAG: carboxynorspermidine decarboxylase [Spirochaetales bacterium]|nr:carboxynorspermidine decarboxylase [Spirochaetales bacterium]
METNPTGRLDLSGVKTPAFLVDEVLLEKNCRLLSSLRERTGTKILLALKGFAMFSTFPLVRKYLDGTCASSWNEARLGREEFGKEVHSYSPAYSEQSLQACLELSDHVVFNTPGQLRRFAALRRHYPGVSCGLRINPDHSETETAIYDPSAPYSRLGSLRSEIEKGFLCELDGIHVHNLCEKNADALVRTWQTVEKQFGDELGELKWINLGGGHHITRPDYDIELLTNLLVEIRDKYGVQLYLEPGEAVALNCGWLATTVLDTMHNAMDIAVLDTSASCHMPDVLEMPYRPDIYGAGTPGEKQHTYRLGGVSCLAGDVIGDYSFERQIKPGDVLLFGDMAHYSMVKTTTFNGIALPSIYLFNSVSGEARLVRQFTYEDFRGRLS